MAQYPAWRIFRHSGFHYFDGDRLPFTDATWALQADGRIYTNDRTFHLSDLTLADIPPARASAPIYQYWVSEAEKTADRARDEVSRAAAVRDTLREELRRWR